MCSRQSLSNLTTLDGCLFPCREAGVYAALTLSLLSNDMNSYQISCLICVHILTFAEIPVAARLFAEMTVAAEGSWQSRLADGR